ncbi:MAG: hypothetical protein RL385_1311 [Pseudomonadota bacterium]|jgi:predicted outer membrane protein
MITASRFLNASMLSLCLLITTLQGARADANDGASPSAAAASTLTGEYKVAASESEKQARQKSVDKTVSEFFALTRPLARSKIEKKTHIAEWVSVKPGTSNVVIHFEGRGEETCPLKGTSKGKDPEGNDAEFAAHWDGEKLIQTVTTEEGKRTNTFTPQPDGTLKVLVELRSKKFETPVRYALSYAKK